jgi:hypothetical protein
MVQLTWLLTRGGGFGTWRERMLQLTWLLTRGGGFALAAAYTSFVMSQNTATRGDIFNRTMDDAELEMVLERSVARVNRKADVDQFWRSSPLVRNGGLVLQDTPGAAAAIYPLGQGSFSDGMPLGISAAATNGNGRGAASEDLPRLFPPSPWE